jgi:hypothetical protein
MKFYISIFILILSFHALAQTEAVTNDGRKVILNKNGTWKYAKTASITKPIASDLKKEAIAFSMDLVRSYFDRDCNVLKESLASEVYTSASAVKLTDEMKQKICVAVKSAVKDTSKTFKDYEQVYKTELISKTEVEAKAKAKLPTHFDSIADEFYFLGFEKRSPSTTDFIEVRLFALLIRKVNGKWQVKGFLND